MLLSALAVSPLLGLHAQQPAATPATSPAPQVKVDPEPLQRTPPSVTSFAPVVDRVAPTVVNIFTTRAVRRQLRPHPFFDYGPYRGLDPRQMPAPNRRQQGLGSGVIVTPEGHVLTSNHVIDGADEIMVNVGAEQKSYKATKIGTDPGTDLAVLKIEGEQFPAISFADIDKTRVGDLVLAIGNPFGVGQSVTMGIISAKGRGGMGMVDYENFIQTDAPINPGNSGGALVDFEGRLVGINTAIVSRTGASAGVGFAVPADLARNVMQSILEKGRVVRGHLGVVVQPITEELASTFGLKESGGALVTEVTPQSPAAQNGVEEGDVITHLNGEKISDPRDLQLTVGSMQPGTKVEIKFLRDVQVKTAQIELGEVPGSDRVAARGEPSRQSGPSVLSGLSIADIDPRLRQRYNLPTELTGAVVTGVAPSSPAAEAGLRKGDVIRQIARKDVENATEAIAVSRKLKADDGVLMLLWSGGRQRYVVVDGDNANQAG